MLVTALANERGSPGPVLVGSTGVKGSIESSNGAGCPGLVKRHEGGRVGSGCMGLQAAGDGAVGTHVLREEAVEVVSALLGQGSGALGAGTGGRELGEQGKDSLDTTSRLRLPVASGRLKVGVGGRGRHGESQTRLQSERRAERGDIEERSRQL